MNQHSNDQKRKEANRGTVKLSEYRVKRQSTIEELSIKREFYGLDEAKSFFLDIWNTHKNIILNFTILFFYLLFGGVYFSKPDIMNKPMGDLDSPNSIALVCLYYMTVTMTSVGYGDYFPVTDQARIFTIFFIFFGIGVIGRILNDFAQTIVNFAETKAAERRNRNESVEEMTLSSRLGLQHLGKIVNAIGSAFLTLMCGTCFFAINEKWDFNQAFYFVVVTSSTVGYGDVLPSCDSSRLFAVFYILTSCIIIAIAIGNIAQIFMDIADERRRLAMMKVRWVLLLLLLLLLCSSVGLVCTRTQPLTLPLPHTPPSHPPNRTQRKLDFNMIRELDKEGKGIDKATFLTGMLVELGLVSEEKDVKPWIRKFEELDKSGDGLLNVEDVIMKLEHEEEDRVNHLLQVLSKAEEDHKVMDVLGNITNFLHLTHAAADEQSASLTGGGSVEMTGKGRSATQVPTTKTPMRSQV